MSGSDYNAIVWSLISLEGVAWTLSIWKPRPRSKYLGAADRDNESESAQTFEQAPLKLRVAYHLYDYLVMFSVMILVSALLIVRLEFRIRETDPDEAEKKVEKWSIVSAACVAGIVKLMHIIGGKPGEAVFYAIWIGIVVSIMTHIATEPVNDDLWQDIGALAPPLGLVIMVAVLLYMCTKTAFVTISRLVFHFLVRDMTNSIALAYNAGAIHHHWTYYVLGDMDRLWLPLGIGFGIGCVHYILVEFKFARNALVSCTACVWSTVAAFFHACAKQTKREQEEAEREELLTRLRT